MKSLNQAELFETAKRYYPHLNPLDPASYDVTDNRWELKKSLETAAFLEVWERVMREDHAHWLTTVKAIRNELPGVDVWDTTAPGHCGSLRCAVYAKDQPLVGGASLGTLVVGFKSVLAPVYGVAWAQRVSSGLGAPWKAASFEIPEELRFYADVIGKHVEREGQFQRLTVELGQIKLPGLSVGHLPFGEATLFDALLDSQPENQP